MSDNESSDEMPKNTKAKSAKDFKTKEVTEKGYTFPISRTGSNERRVTVSKFHGKVRVDIREYYLDDDTWKPGKKGISLDQKQWEKMMSYAELIEEAMEELA